MKPIPYTGSSTPASFCHFDAYEFSVCYVNNESVSVSNLVVIADGADPETVFKDRMNVHHTNGVPWDNRPDNLEVVMADEHARIHHSGRQYDHSDDPWWDENTLRDMYWNEGMTMKEIAERFDVSQSSIRDRFQDFDIETRSRGRTKPKPWHNEENLREAYIESDNTQKEAAEELGCSTPTLRKWLQKYDLIPSV